VLPCGFVRTDVSEEPIASIIRVKRTSELGTVLAVTSKSSKLILSTLMIKVICYSETSVLTRATWRHNPEDGILLFESSGREGLHKFNPLDVFCHIML
jgi:hypothetical protein